MKKLLLTLFAAFLTMALEAEKTVTLSFQDFAFDGADAWTSSYAARTVNFADAVVVFEKANRQPDGNAITDCPVTKGNGVTVTAQSPILKVSAVLKQWGTKAQTATIKAGDVEVATTSDFAIAEAAMPAGAKSFTLSFSSQSNQVGIVSFTLVLDEAGDGPQADVVAAPVIEAELNAAGTAYTVTLTQEAGYSIYYTLDGSTPDDASSLYVAPFEVSTTTTVKAVAYNDDDVKSDVVSRKLQIVRSIANTAQTAYSTAEAIALIDDPDANLKDSVYVKGTVSKVGNIGKSGELIYYLDDDAFEVYYGKGLNGELFTADNVLAHGDYVVIKCLLTKYGSTYETVSGSSYIVEYVPYVPATPRQHIANTPETAYTSAEAIAFYDNQDNYYLSDSVYIKGTVSEVIGSLSNGRISFYIDGGAFEGYRVYGLEGEKIASSDYLKVGDEVVFYGVITKYKSTYETAQDGRLYSINGTVTAIGRLSADAVGEPQEVYDLLGKPVKVMKRPGVYIVGGKKVVLR